MASPPKKSLSNTSSFRYGETFLKAGEHEDLCGICQQPFENHSADFNIDLLYLQNKYGEMLNQVTQIDTVSRPFTANSVYSLLSRKHSPNSNVIDKLVVPKLNVITESNYGNFLDGSQNQAGSTWNVPPPLTKSHIGSNADSDYISKVERVKIEHYNQRTKALKHLYASGVIRISEERRPSRFHLKCPICLEYCKNSFELSECGHNF